jgi:hypothetical protein
MDRLVEARNLGALVASLYSAGVQLALSDDGKREALHRPQARREPPSLVRLLRAPCRGS